MDKKFKNIQFENWDEFYNINKLDVNEIIQWFKKFEEVMDINKLEKRIIMLIGYPSSLKSELAKFILTKMNYNIRLFNAIDMRGTKSIKECIVQIINSKSILHMLYRKPDKIGIILDDLDIPNNSNDKTIITDFFSLLSVKKRGKKEDILKITHPIICVCHETNDKKVNELKKIALVIRLNKFTNNDFIKYIEKITLINNIELDNDQKNKILSVLDNDIRKINNFIKDIFYFYKTNNEIEKINSDCIDNALESFCRKNTSEKSIDKLNEIFTDTELNIDECINKFYSDKFLYPFMIHENYLYSIPDKVGVPKILNYCKNISRNLSKNDVIQNLIFEKQLWELNNNSAILTLAKTNLIHKNIMKDVSCQFIFTKRKYTTLLNKVSLYYTNRKVYNTLLQKYGITYMEVYLLSEIVRILITNKSKKNAVNDLVDIMRYLNLDLDYIDLMVRINKFGNIDIKKYDTCKYKSEIKKKLEEYLHL